MATSIRYGRGSCRCGESVSREPVGLSAFVHREFAFVVNVIATWTDANEDAAHIAWARPAFNQLRPFSKGAAYGSSLGRLSGLKRSYDPDSIFHLNQNIAPGQGETPPRGTSARRLNPTVRVSSSVTQLYRRRSSPGCVRTSTPRSRRTSPAR